MSSGGPAWRQDVLRTMRRFADRYGSTYSKTDRTLAAYFEIGCFLSLVEFYEDNGYRGYVEGANSYDGSYRYLTTPNGNPANFSYLRMVLEQEVIELRQQVRVVSHIGSDIAFTPDIVVLPSGTEIGSRHDPDYANGVRRFFYVHSRQVIAAHECKSLPPFPELLISFLGTVTAAHAWIDEVDPATVISEDGKHLAPTLFVGGTARALHLRMIEGLKKAFPLNIVVGMHSGTWDLHGEHARIRRMVNPLVETVGVTVAR